MAKNRGPAADIELHGWLGRYTFRMLGVVPTPYPISLQGKIRIPSGWTLSLFGNTYKIPAFDLRPYGPFISQYYSVKGWCYQMRRTWHGMQSTAIHPPDHELPQNSKVAGAQVRLGEAVVIWKGMNQATKDVYNSWRTHKHASGYNKFISWYLRTTPHMPIYWGTLQRSAVDNRTIENKMVDQDAPVIRYPFNFRQYQLFNTVFHQGPGFPENPVEGQFFYRNDEDKLYKYDGAAWGEIGGGAGGGHTIQKEGVSLAARTYLNFYGLGVTAGDDPGNNRTSVYIPTPTLTDTRVATIVVAADGSGDYTDIQDGIDALPAAGGLVYVKNGTYIITSGLIILKSNVVLEGQSEASIIYMNNGAAEDMLSIGDGVNPYSHITVKNLTFDGNAVANPGSYGISIFANTSYIKILHNYIWNQNSISIFVNGASDHLDIIGNIIEAGPTKAISLTKCDMTLIQANRFFDRAGGSGNAIGINNCVRLKIIGNMFNYSQGASAGAGIYCWDTAGTPTYLSNDVTIVGNTFKGCSYGISGGSGSAGGERWTVVGNTIIDPRSAGIFGIGAHSSVVGNSIQNPLWYGIYVNSTFVAYIGNSIENCGRNGIHIIGNDNVIKDNIIDYCQWFGIYGLSCRRNLIQGNRIQDVSMAANSVFSGIYIDGTAGTNSYENTIFDNIIQLPAAGNRKAYSIREYGPYVDYSLIRGNRCRNALQKEIQVIGANSEAFDNQTIGI